MAPGSDAEGEAVSGAQLIAESLKAQVRGWGTGKGLPYGEREGTVTAGHAARGAPGPRVPAGLESSGCAQPDSPWAALPISRRRAQRAGRARPVGEREVPPQRLGPPSCCAAAGRPEVVPPARRCPVLHLFLPDELAPSRAQPAPLLPSSGADRPLPVAVPPSLLSKVCVDLELEMLLN